MPSQRDSLTIKGEWVSISGKAELSKDRPKVEKYYSPTLKAWLGDLGDGIHDGSPNDPVHYQSCLSMRLIVAYRSYCCKGYNGNLYGFEDVACYEGL